MNGFDWSLMQSFLAVAEHGSYSAAARAIGSSQPTIGRHIQELEAQLSATLFQRQTRGHNLTETGERLLDHARAMEKAAAEISLAAAGQGKAVAGTVRISASVMVSHYLLPPILARLRRTAPEIEIELHATDESDNLLYHEADIAIRMYEPTQLDVITRKVGRQQFGIFATRAYLRRSGIPTSAADLADHDFLGFDRSDVLIRGMRDLGIEVARADFPIRCDNQTTYFELVRAGAGLGIAAVPVAERDPTLVRVLHDVPIPELPIWLTAHQALRTAPRVRRVYDVLAAELAQATAA